MKYKMLIIYSKLVLIIILQAPPPSFAQNIKTIHVFVALCDNVHQGIVPVSKSLGDGDSPNTNLYWGAMYGVRTFIKNSADWELVKTVKNPKNGVLERCVFKHKDGNVYMVADAYQGKEIKQATIDFLDAAAGKAKDPLKLQIDKHDVSINTSGASDLVVYIGHNGLMDFELSEYPKGKSDNNIKVIILACASKQYFTGAIKKANASPLLWTTNLMAPEAYVLEAALSGWVKNESDEEIRLRAAKAYNKYQKCGLNAAKNLLVSGF